MMIQELITKYEQQIAKWEVIIEQRTFQQAQQFVSRKIMLEEVVQELKKINERQKIIKNKKL